MKKAIFTLSTLVIMSEANYKAAVLDAQNSCGSDSCIVEAMAAHGFECDVFEDVTEVDKMKALANTFNIF